MLEDIPDNIKDRIKQLWDEGYTKAEILRYCKTSYPNHKFYFNKISRLIDIIGTQEDDKLAVATYRDLVEEIDTIQDWVKEKTDITSMQNKALKRKLSNLKDRIRIKMREKGDNEKKLERVANTLQIEFTNDVLNPCFRRFPKLKPFFMIYFKKFWRDKYGSYYLDPEDEAKDLGKKL